VSTLRRLHPPGGELTPEEATSGLRLGDRAPDGRPYVVCNMITTLDGHATLGGRSGPLGDDVDQAIFHGLRTQTDAILAGTGTLRAERYGRLVRDPAYRARREREGLAPDPIACVISRSGNVPFDIPLFRDPDSVVALYAPEHAPIEDCEARLHITSLPVEELHPGAVLPRLRADHGVRSVLCEGGPTLNRSLIADAVLDELFLSLAPKVSAEPDALAMVKGPALDEPVALRLVSALEAADALYLRYALAPTGA
jgi:riboflavin biosynthesis pyrimidine reductase